MPRYGDITGRRFGRLIVISLHKKGRAYPQAHRQWFCRCDCGNQLVVLSPHLITGHTKSCGCLKRDLATKHGQSRRAGKTGIYESWDAMIQRCTNSKTKAFKDYGGRGIKVCDRWLAFGNFLVDMGPRPSGWTIERIDNDGPYEPGNCKWIPKADQWKNKRPRRDARKAPQPE